MMFKPPPKSPSTRPPPPTLKHALAEPRGITSAGASPPASTMPTSMRPGARKPIVVDDDASKRSRLRTLLEACDVVMHGVGGITLAKIRKIVG